MFLLHNSRLIELLFFLFYWLLVNFKTVFELLFRCFDVLFFIFYNYLINLLSFNYLLNNFFHFLRHNIFFDFRLFFFFMTHLFMDDLMSADNLLIVMFFLKTFFEFRHILFDVLYSLRVRLDSELILPRHFRGLSAHKAWHCVVADDCVLLACRERVFFNSVDSLAILNFHYDLSVKLLLVLDLIGPPRSDHWLALFLLDRRN